MPLENEPQRIRRLTAMSDVLERVDTLARPVVPRAKRLQWAIGRTLAEEVIASAGLPAAARVLRDGFAVCAELTADASTYAPAPLPTGQRVDVGDLLPAGTDAVAPLDAISLRDGQCEALAPITHGDGVLAPAGDLRSGTILRHAGERLRGVDEAVLAAIGVDRVMVREPMIRVVTARSGANAVLDAAKTLVARAVVAWGGTTPDVHAGNAEVHDLHSALRDPHADAVIVVGGTGTGRNDFSVQTVGQLGRVEVHGFAMTPGETAALGIVDGRPVLLIPGRIDAALAVWLLVGRRLLARLAGGSEDTCATKLNLARKVASPLGLTEIVPVRVVDGLASPLASGYWPIGVIAQADGWILVPPESEGYPAGAEVMVRPWP